MAARAAQLLRWTLLAAALSVLQPSAPAQQALPPPDSVLPPPSAVPPSPPPPVFGAPIPPPNPGPFTPAPLPDARDPLYQPRDPGQNGWGLYDLPSMPENFFADVEVDILKPHLKAVISNTVTFPDGSQTTVQPPTTQVGWTAAPRIEVGWFIPPNLGFFALSYRGFASEGNQNAIGIDGTPYALRTRLDVNYAAFDYGTTPYSFSPRWFISGRIGVAAADVFFDNRAVSAFQTLYGSNNYYGAGPHTRLDLWREFGLVPGLSIFAQGDLTVLVGQIHQPVSETDFNITGSSVFGSFIQRKTQTVPVFSLRTGVSYAPPSLSNWRFMLGYEFEEWWFVGQIDGLNSRGQFNTNGVFLRALVSF